MATEIELKARVKNSETLRRLLSEKAEYAFSFKREDVYWFSGASDPARIRVRKETRILPESAAEIRRTFATYKKKQVKDGIEINDEHEFEIAGQADEFEGLLKIMGLNPGFSKQKQGWTFTKDEITAELLEVEGLGWFIELEIVAANPAENDAEKTLEKNKNRLLDFLDSLGISREEIESRFYSELLANPTLPG